MPTVPGPKLTIFPEAFGCDITEIEGVGKLVFQDFMADPFCARVYVPPQFLKQQIEGLQAQLARLKAQEAGQDQLVVPDSQIIVPGGRKGKINGRG